MVTKHPNLPSLDPRKYTWQKCSDSPGRERRALAGENMWIHREKQYQQMFLGGSLVLEKSVSKFKFYAASKNSWQRLRLQTPDIAVIANCAVEGKVYMQAQAPQDNNEADWWCSETLYVEFGQRESHFGEMKEKISLKRASQSANCPHPALIMFDTKADDNNEAKEISFMLNVEHQITDGIGIRILLSKYLTLLATELLEPSSVYEMMGLPWEGSLKSLSPPWTSLLDEKQVLSGPSYEDAVLDNQDFLLTKMGENIGLPVLQATTHVEQKTHSVMLTEEQTTLLLEKIKVVIGPNANITHLGHASTILGLLRRNSYQSLPPSSSEKDMIYSPCWLNGRRYIRPSGCHLPASKTYIPICQSFAPIKFSAHELALSPSATDMEIRDKVIQTCRIATEQYSIIKERESIMPESVALLEYLGDMMYQSRKRTSLSDQGSIQNQTAHPFFLSDGITENYIDREYYQGSDEESSGREKVLEVNDIHFTAHAEGPNLIVRMSTWRGRLTISGEWRSCDYETEMAVGFLEDIVKMMLTITMND